MFFKKILHVMPGLCTHSFKHGSLVAYDYAFLTVARNMNQCPYFNNLFFILKFFDLYLNRIGDFFFIVYQDLLTNDLRGKKLFIFIGQLILREISRALRKL